MVVVPDPVVPESVRARTRLLGQVRALAESFEQAERDLVRLRGGRPVCVAQCAACCRRTTPAVTEPEAAFVSANLHALSPPARERLWGRLERWLTDPAPPGATPTERAQALMAQSCPFLDGADCAIYPWRPLMCRAYSVTRAPAPFCKRPRVGPENGTTIWGVLDTEWAQGLRLLVGRYYRVLRETLGMRAAFLPALVALQWWPGRVAALPVSPGRLLATTEPAALLFEDQLVQLGWGGGLLTDRPAGAGAAFDRFPEAHRVPDDHPALAGRAGGAP